MKKINYFLVGLILLIIPFVHVDASVNTRVRTEENNYGVNKKWEITDLNKKNILATDYVDAEEKIYDFAGILKDSEKLILKEKIDNFINKYNVELIILTVSVPYYADSKNEEIAADFYDYNDFGLNIPDYDGIVIYRNANPNDPYYDIYTFGKAQLYFDQSRYDKILDGVYYELSNKYYLEGFSEFIDSIADYYSKGKASSYTAAYIDDMGFIQYKFQPPYFVATTAGLIISSIVLAIFVGRNKMIKKAMKADAYLDLSTIDYTVRNNTFINSVTSSYTVSSSSSGGGHSSGGHSSSGSSGGGHSSGGGRHG